jgi:hypothetical protein
VLGLGMAITVAPLTTAVMSSISREHAGVASGINNATAEAAGLLAVAVLGLAMTHAFRSGLERRMDGIGLQPAVREEIRRDEPKLAALEIPRQVTARERDLLQRAIGESFIGGFRLVMAIAAGLALSSAVCAAIFLEADRRTPQAHNESGRPSEG